MIFIPYWRVILSLSEKLYLLGFIVYTGLFGAFVDAAPTTSLNRRAEIPEGVPDYVLSYAPIIYLYSGDPYFPSDIASLPANTIPYLDYDIIPDAPPTSSLNLDNLDQLNSFGPSNGRSVYLTSIEDPSLVNGPQAQPDYLFGVGPDADGVTGGGATTAVVVTVEKRGGIVDAFYFYFYAYNWGGRLLDNLNLGNHVGDWEHNMIRFEDGIPTYIWYSQHESGQAFNYDILIKEGARPIAYSANGSHANYAITGDHDHLIPNLNLPNGIYEDKTDAGVRWDPIRAAYFYSYEEEDDGSGTFTPYDGVSPTAYLYFNGRWGDKEYEDDDPRQFDLFGINRYGNGPRGPKDKQLGREQVCLDTGIPCILRNRLAP